jgi:hypothetical protein
MNLKQSISDADLELKLISVSPTTAMIANSPIDDERNITALDLAVDFAVIRERSMPSFEN